MEDYSNERWAHFDTTKAGGRHPGNKERYWWISDHGRVKVTCNYSDVVKWPSVSLSGGKPGNRYAALAPNYLVNKYIHKLVAIHFCHNPYGVYEGREITVDHIDENKLNNHYTNLRWVTMVDNVRNYWANRKAGIDRNIPEQEIERPETREDVDQQIIELYLSGLAGTKIMEQMDLTFARVYRPIREWRLANGVTTNNRKGGGSPLKQS